MEYIIIIGIIFLIVILLKKKKILKFLFAIGLVIACVYVAVNFFNMLSAFDSSFLSIIIYGAIALIAFLIVASIIYLAAERAKDKKGIKRWLALPVNQYTAEDIENYIERYATILDDSDRNKRKYSNIFYNIPYGRTNCFLSYFERTIYNEEPIYYSAVRSKIKEELREYGTLLTSAGLYVSFQTDKKSNNGNLVMNTELPFSGIYRITELTDKSLTVRYADLRKVTLYQDHTTIPLGVIGQMISEVINSGLTLAMYKKCISDDAKDDFDIDRYMNFADSSFNTVRNAECLKKATTTSGTAASLDGIMDNINQLGNRMNGAQGHGFAAEYANNTIDKALGKNAKIVGNDNAKYGADRSVNGVNIQTKYCRTASESIGAAFSSGKAKYIDPKTGKMMPIEVPRDQYKESVDLMKTRIKNGEVPGETNSENAEKYVKKGHVTYPESQNIAKAGTVESLKIDLLSGAISSLSSAGVTAVVTFATQVWNGSDVKAAAKTSLFVSAKVIGKGAVISAVVQQLVREKSEYSLKILNSIHSSIRNGSSTLATKISSSKLAQSNFGQKIGLDKVTNKMVIANGMMIVVSYGPDIAMALVGRISLKQLFKNAGITTASVAGAAIGNTILPVVGGVIGGVATGYLAKKVLDIFIEDDAVEMYEQLREEFIDVVMLSNLNKDEFEEAVNAIFLDKKLNKKLRDMYASKNSRVHAREKIVNETIVSILKKRRIITTAIVEDAFAGAIQELCTSN